MFDEWLPCQLLLRTERAQVETKNNWHTLCMFSFYAQIHARFPFAKQIIARVAEKIYYMHKLNLTLQYFELVRAHPRTPPSELYGVVHFTRFVSKLPAFLRSQATAEMPLLNEHRMLWILSRLNQECADMIQADPVCVAYKPGNKAYFARFDTAEKYLAMVKEGHLLLPRGLKPPPVDIIRILLLGCKRI